MNTSHERVKDGTDVWLTPPKLLARLGEFDLDPCSPVNRPWDTAKKHFTEIDNGLMQNWEGRVFLNPPYGNQAIHWIGKCAMHGNAIALVFTRTDTKMFHEYVFGVADGILFLKKRLSFFRIDGTEATDSAGAPSCLIAYGQHNAEVLKSLTDLGAYVALKTVL